MLHTHMPQIPLDGPLPTTTSSRCPIISSPRSSMASCGRHRGPHPGTPRADQRLDAILGPAFDRGGGGRGGWRVLPNLNCIWAPCCRAGHRRLAHRADVALAGYGPLHVRARLDLRDSLPVDRSPRPRQEAADLRGSRRGVRVARRSDCAVARGAEATRHASGTASWVPLATHVGGHAVQAEPFEGVDIRLGWLWDEE